MGPPLEVRGRSVLHHSGAPDSSRHSITYDPAANDSQTLLFSPARPGLVCRRSGANSDRMRIRYLPAGLAQRDEDTFFEFCSSVFGGSMRGEFANKPVKFGIRDKITGHFRGGARTWCHLGASPQNTDPGLSDLALSPRPSLAVRELWASHGQCPAPERSPRRSSQRAFDPASAFHR